MDPQDTAPAPAPAPAPAEPVQNADPAPAPIPQTAEPVPAPTEKPAAAAPVVPEKYEFKLPENFVDPTISDRIAVVAKKLALPAEAAQSLMDAAVAEVAKISSGIETERDKMIDTWEAEARADKEFGGVNLDANLELGKRVLARFADERLIKDLTESGFGNHPGMVRLLAQIGKGMKEDDFISSNAGNDGHAVKDTASKLYDHETSKT